ncbi:MAG: caspase family protein [Nitratireductor sp.]|nr:caspase family protein [Nitratireductor sp.]
MTASALKIVGRPGLRNLLAAATSVLFVLALTVAGAQASTGKRVAMVVGNSAYEHAPQLANPSNDAADMASALRSIGFVVIEGQDLTNRGMRDKIREFSSELRGADVGMLFYAGHGLQVNGQNYLAPIDAKLDFESDLDFETIPLDFIQRQMEREVKTILLFLDACRDNPLTRSFKSASRSGGAGKGLAEVKSAPGTLIAFSTDPNNVALDGKGRNSPFTTALLNNIGRKDVEVQTMMTLVRKDVFDNTDEQQTPWINSSLLGAFYFVSDEDATAATASAETSSSNASGSSTTRASSNGSSVDNAQIEKLAWDSVKDSNNPDELQAFISSFGSSFFGKLARLKLQRLREAAKETETAGQANTDDPAREQQVASLEQPKEAKEATRKLEPELDPREIVQGIQEELVRLSCNPGRPDGIWGRRSQSALDSFARSAKVQLASAQPDAELFDQLKNYDGKGCPVARSCPSGQRMNSRGQCYTPQRQVNTEAPRTRSARQQVIEQPQQQRVIVRQPQQQQVIIQQQPQQQVIVEQQPGVIVQQPGVIVEQQPQPRPNPIGGLIGGAIRFGAGCVLLGGC